MYTIPIILGIIGIIVFIIMCCANVEIGGVANTVLVIIVALFLTPSVVSGAKIHDIQQTNCTAKINYYTKAKVYTKHHYTAKFHKLNRGQIKKYNHKIHIYKCDRTYKKHPTLNNYLSMLLTIK